MTVGQADPAWIEELGRRVEGCVPDWAPCGRVREVRPLTGGTSSLTFLVELDGVPAADSTVVLKVAPPGLAPVRNRDVLRQARLQKALNDAGRPIAPDVLFSDPGAPPAVPPFMAMNLVAGECLEPLLLPAAKRPATARVRSRYLAAARRLAELHRIPLADLGLQDEPVAALAEEIDRWTKAFRTLPEGLRGNFETAAEALHDTMPQALAPVVNHGDYRLGNVLCEGDDLTAIIDWEIWSVGDPRVDIAWLTYFTDDAGHPAAEPGPSAGTPTAQEVVEEYQEALGEALPDLDWFRALTRYKEASLTGLLVKRAHKDGRVLSGAMARMEPALPRLVDEALELVGR
ncbi:phosphotransferase family protein [Nocardioides sp. cx-169]|uniref:phosphotransferase family protein n=1 Tax=Nocardioides sp. cx-169 TaxID=2899080 RepID=UPI001E48D14D|nr:phosphotransferase [Nocardioides sp. cx-169]MCD4533042.1 phosphotransferase family protein [Nocardioides sp. cx-169]